MNTMPTHYRFRDIIEPSGKVTVIRDSFYPYRQTECFYWLLDANNNKLKNMGLNFDWDKRAIKVGKNSCKPKYSPDEEIALRSFVARKRWQAMYPLRALRSSKHILDTLVNDDKSMVDTLNTYGFVGSFEGSNIEFPYKTYRLGLAEKVVDFEPFKFKIERYFE